MEDRLTNQTQRKEEMNQPDTEGGNEPAVLKNGTTMWQSAD